MADLSVDFCGIRFKNPMVVSSIEATNSLANLMKCIDHGAAGAIVKTLTDMPQMVQLTKHAKYAILNTAGEIIKGRVPRDYVFYSRSGFSSTFYKDWVDDLKAAQAYADRRDAHIIASIGASTPDVWCDIARTGEDCGVRMIELNFGCPHTSQMNRVESGVLIGQDPEIAAEITGRVVESVSIPVIVKLTPQVADVVRIARAVREAGASGATVHTRFTGFAVDIESGKPYINGTAGVGGPWVKFVTLRWVHEVHSKLGMPIAGSNGIFDWRDAIEFFMSGATLMQIGSVLMLKGYEHLPTVIDGINAFLDEHGHPSVRSIIGIASRRAAETYDHLFEARGIRAVVDDDKCIRCWSCVQSCFYKALSRGEEEVLTHSDRCIGCEMCYSICPVEAISFASKD